jgi:type II secretory pathway component PulF
MSRAEPSTPKPVSLADLIAFNEELAALVRVGLPIEVGLGGAELPKNIRWITQRFREEMQRGASLPEALEHCGAEFPPSYVALIEAGLRSNRLSDALVSAGNFARTLLGMQHQVRSALVYPLFVLAIAFTFFLLLLKELLPRIESLLVTSGGAPDGLLRGLQYLSQTMLYWGPILPAAILVYGLLTGLIPVPFFRPSALAVERIYLLPWVGRIIRDGQSAGFCQLLGILVDREVPLAQSLELASAASGDRRLTVDCKRIASELRRGVPLNECLKTAENLPPFLRWMMASGNDHGGLAAVMVTLADIYRRRAESQRQLFSLSAPLILTVVIAGTAVTAYSLLVFVPMRNLFMQLLLDPLP